MAEWEDGRAGERQGGAGGQKSRRTTEREDGRAGEQQGRRMAGRSRRMAEQEDGRAGGWQSGRMAGQSGRTARQEDGRAGGREGTGSSVITMCRSQGSTEPTRVSLICLWWRNLLCQPQGHWPVSVVTLLLAVARPQRTLPRPHTVTDMALVDSRRFVVA